MKKIGKTTIFVVLALVLALGAYGVHRATAVEPGKYLVDGNPTCSDLYMATVLDGPADSLLDLGPLFGFKIDNYSDYYTPPSGDLEFTLTAGTQHGYPTVLTPPTPSDPDNSVTLINSSEYLFDWAATLGIDAVIVKAQDANAYVYAPEAFGSSGLMAPDGKGISHIEFCYDYELVAEKTADAEYTRTYTWEITKDYDGEYWKFIGDTADTHNYTVSVNQTVADSDFMVTGEITVNNPTPFIVDFSVSDFVGVTDTDPGTAAAVTCPDGYTLAAGASTICTYVAELGDALPPDGTNVATITSSNTYVDGATATEDYAFGDPTTTVGYPDINVTDTNGESWMASGDATWTYTKDFVCSSNPADYTDGYYSFTHDNTATIVETSQSDDATVKVHCYAPVPSKTAEASYTATYTWDITKDFDGEYWKFIGDPASTHGYKVSVDQTITDSPYLVAGVITVQNPNPKAAMNVSLADSVGGTAATLDCGGTLSVPAGGSATCGYSAELAAPTDGTNTATVTFNTIDFPATKDYTFTRYVDGYEEIHVTDTNGGSWTASGDAYWEYTKDFVCPTDTSLYADGVYTAPDDVNTAEITETEQSDDATVKLTCYAPVISKDAYGSYDEYHDWTVDKSVDPTQQSAFVGDTVDFNWTVTVNEEIWEENFGVTGQINVTNPAPMAMTVALADVLNDGTVPTITGCSDSGVTWDGTNLYVPAGVTAVCDYEAADTGGPGLNNFAAALPDSVQFKVAYPVSGGDAYFPTVTVAGGTVLDGTYDGWCIDTDHTIANNTWYNANVYSSYEDMTGLVEYPENMDLVNWILNQDFVYQVSPGCGGGYTYGDVQRAIWELVEDNPLTDGLGSWSPCRVSEIKAAAFAVGEGFVPDCGDFIAVVLQSTTGEQVIAVTQVTIIEVGLDCPAENTATATLNGIDFSASADIVWTKTVVHEGVTLDDDQNAEWPIDLTDGGEWTYADSYECSTNLDLYTGGGGTTYQEKIENTATLYDGEEQLDDDYAYTLVDCYKPTISKTAAGTYDERHEWTVEKEVTPLTNSGNPGDVLGWTWSVEVTEVVTEENFDVAGTITVGNPNPEDTLVVPLSDYLSDGTAVVIDQTSCDFDGTNLTVQPNSSESCNYTADDLGYADDEFAPNNNTAWIVLNYISFSADDAIEWTANRIRENATLSDFEIGLGESLTGHAQAGTYTFGPYTGSDSHTCSTNRADYFVEGVYTQMTDTIENWAYVYSDGEEQDKDDATTTWTCDASFVDVHKTTNGSVDPTKDIRFRLYDALGTDLNDEVSTLGDQDGTLPFATALVPGDSYTICEAPVPAGYTFEVIDWQIDVTNSEIVLTYAGPPGEENPTGEFQCFDFVAKPAGTTATYNINNSYPGGAPRTPGYWKNWNRCSGGNQAETADKLNNYLDPWDEDAAGVFLLDDLLPQTIGSFEITTCDVGVSVLSTYSLAGKNMNNDAAYTLATALLAARLNQDAGACPVSPTQWDEYKTWYLAEYGTEIGFDNFEAVLTAADDLLAGVGFDATDGYLGPKDKKLKDLAADALFLYGIIDDYNNSEICTGEPSH